MRCKDLAKSIERIQPEATLDDVARLCLLLSNSVENIDDLSDEHVLTNAWQEMGLRMQAATDQHTAMTEELSDLASSDPADFHQDQIWILIRAIKVQSQMLQMYVGHPMLDV